MSLLHSKNVKISTEDTDIIIYLDYYLIAQPPLIGPQ